MYTVHGRGADLPFFLQNYVPILVQLNLQHSQAQYYGIYLTQTYLYVEHHTESS